MATYVSNTASESEVEFKAECDSLEKAEIPVKRKNVCLEDQKNQDPVIKKKMKIKAEYDSCDITKISEERKHMGEDPMMQTKVEFKADLNSRDMTEISVDGKHLNLEELRKHIKESPTIWKTICALGRRDTDSIKSNCEDKPKILDYLNQDVPAYPTPVEFHVSSVAHVTTEETFQAILESEEIKPPNTEFSWWTLAINQEEIKSAEKLYLQNKKIKMTEPFLNRFTTSPAFQHDKSRYGNYRFTFPLTELMELYKEQNCEGEEPVLRVFKTMFYKQEIVYAVLIHSPQDSKRFGDLPPLEDSRFARYKDGQIIWDAQAISCDHQCTLSVDTSETPLNVKSLWSSMFYVWDNVCLAFHLPSQKALKIPGKRLVEALDACELHIPNLLRCKNPTECEMMFENAKKAVDDLKKGHEMSVEFKADLNSRDMTEISVDGKHLNLEELRKHIKESPTIWKTICALGRRDTDSIKSNCEDKPKILDYLNRDVPAYPTPVEFHVSSVAHVTTEETFQAILESEEIKPPNTEFSWWTLAINQEEIKSAEKLYLQNKKIKMTEPFLNRFTTSPAFQHDKSRYGNYRFTFPLTELMELYKEQNCEGEEPVLRVFKTMFYKQEIVYAVLIHSPQDSKRFGDLPPLEDSRFARYKDGQIIWDAQAISCDHQCTLSVDTSETPLNVKSLWSSMFYVWDNVCLAFHLPSQKALKIPGKRLVEALDACELHIPNLLRCKNPTECEMMFENAKKAVDDLKKGQEMNVSVENESEEE